VSESDSGSAAVLLKAMQWERDGHAFYLAAAEQTQAQAGRSMFLSLARDELQHLQILDGVYRSWLGEGAWPGPEELALEGSRRWPVFPPPAAAAKVVPARAGELDALRQGIAAEEASIALYEQGLQTASTAQAREVYQYLVRQEEGHRTILQGEYNHLANTGFWFDLREFDLEAMG
jgi:rubrerythrin